MDRMFRRLLALLAPLLLFVACGAPAATTPPNTAPASAPKAAFAQMNVTQLKQQMDSGAALFLLDVRTPEEFTGDGHVKGATLIPLDQLPNRLNELPKDKPIACFCRSGNRSTTACTLLAEQGFTNLSNVQGGINAWKQAGYAVEN